MSNLSPFPVIVLLLLSLLFVAKNIGAPEVPTSAAANRSTTTTAAATLDDYEEGEEEEGEVDAAGAQLADNGVSKIIPFSLDNSTKPNRIISNTSKMFSVIGEFAPGDDFQPKFHGRIVSRTQLNHTDAAKKVQPTVTDYDWNGNGDEDGDRHEENVLASSTSGTSATTTTTTTTAVPTTTNRSSVFSVVREYTPGDDFRPKFGGRIIPRTELNLTDAAKKVQPSHADYYDDYDIENEDEFSEDEGPAENEDDDDDRERKPPTAKPEVSTEDQEDDPYPNPTGHLPDILDRLLRGPKETEVNGDSRPEDIYLYLDRLMAGETAAMVKSALPRVYDYQYPIGDRLSSRCFNSITMFADKMRQGYLWPHKMLSTWGTAFSPNQMSLRNYGHFDRCLDVVAIDDPHDQSLPIYFLGQYCLVEVLLPLPAEPESIRYQDSVLNVSTKTNNGGPFINFMIRNGPFLYSNPLSVGICVPSTCSGPELESAADYFLQKFRMKIRFNSDCYTRLNLTMKTDESDDLGEDNWVRARWRRAESFPARIGWLAGQLTAAQMFAILYLAGSAIAVVLATIYDIYRVHQSEQCQQPEVTSGGGGGGGGKPWQSRERNRPKSFVACFSARYNIEQIFLVRHRYQFLEVMQPSQDEETTGDPNHNYGQSSPPVLVTGAMDVEDFVMTNRSEPFPMPVAVANTGPLDTFKCLGLLWICMANYFLLGYQPQMLSSLANGPDLIVDLDRHGRYQPVLQSWLTFQLFTMISGFLLAYTSLPKISRHDGRPKLSFFILKRAVRFIPSMAFLVLAINLLPLWPNAGPVYNSSVQRVLESCQTGHGYWRGLLFVANLFHDDNLCLPQLWYISMDFQLTILGVFVLVFGYNRRRHATTAFLALIILGCLMSGYQAARTQVRLGRSIVLDNAILSKIPAIFKALHFSTMVHFSSYFLGMALGYRIRMWSRENAKKPSPFNFTWPIRVLTGITLVAIASAILYIPCIWTNIRSSTGGNDDRLDQMAAIIYYGVARILFASSSTYIVSQLLYRNNVITKVFSWSLMRLASHLSFQTYLWNLVIIWIYLFTKRTVISTEFPESFLVALSLFIITAVFSLFTFVLFEAPYRSLFRYYFESPRIVSISNSDQPMMMAAGNGHAIQLQRAARLNKNPNFLFTPQYNSFYDRSETNSCVSFPNGIDSRRPSQGNLNPDGGASKINDAFEMDHHPNGPT